MEAAQMEFKDCVANVLERETESTIKAWLELVDAVPDIVTVKLTHAERMAHLPALFRDLVVRLRRTFPAGTRELISRDLISDSAHDHGCMRRAHGYTTAMMVEESRMLQVSIFKTLHDRLERLDLSVLLLDIMTIADEVDSQLAQAVASYMNRAEREPVQHRGTRHVGPSLVE